MGGFVAGVIARRIERRGGGHDEGRIIPGGEFGQDVPGRSRPRKTVG
jgi:hypothetical protein